MSRINIEDAHATNSKSRKTLSAHFHKIEKREWGLWSGAVAVTLLLTAGLASFMLPGVGKRIGDESTFLSMPEIVRGLLGLVLIFDIYTLYQQLQIQRIRHKLIQREELFRLISENAAQLIALVEMKANGFSNGISFQRFLDTLLRN